MIITKRSTVSPIQTDLFLDNILTTNAKNALWKRQNNEKSNWFSRNRWEICFFFHLPLASQGQALSSSTLLYCWVVGTKRNPSIRQRISSQKNFLAVFLWLFYRLFSLSLDNGRSTDRALADIPIDFIFVSLLHSSLFFSHWLCSAPLHSSYHRYI